MNLYLHIELVQFFIDYLHSVIVCVAQVRYITCAV